MEISAEKELVIVATAGSVDDGKSTLIGRMLFDCNDIFEDQLASIRKSGPNGEINKEDLALLTDGLASEREQKITIDVAYRHFSRPNRKFIIADVPGHEQYTRNMVTGASKADLVIIIVDARKGVSLQSKRHLLIASLLGINHIVIVVNKMDLMGYEQKVYDSVRKELSGYAAKLGIHDLQFIPISALEGDMVVNRKDNLDWYNGPTLLSYLENVEINSERNLIDFRFPVQYVMRPNQNFRGYAGKIESGTIRMGEDIIALPSSRKSRVKSILLGSRQIDEAFAPQSVLMELEDELDISRGDMLVKVNNLPSVGNDIEVMLNWFSDKPADFNKGYLIKHTTQTVRGFLSKPKYVMDIETLHRAEKEDIEMNDIARTTLRTNTALIFDEYKKLKGTGSFIVIDEVTNETIGAGIIVNKGRGVSGQPGLEAEKRAGRGAVLWFTGLSGAGKTTIADRLYDKLRAMGLKVEKLDGDSVRQHLTRDLGYSRQDREENIRRVGYVAKLLSRNGVIVVASFISPYRKQREELRREIENFIEIHVNTPLEICEKRDVKGMYAKARRGEIESFTGISDPYEDPEKPEITICGDQAERIDGLVQEIVRYLVKNGFIA